MEKDTELAERLLAFVENCTWYGAKEHIADSLRRWVFTDWERIFAATDGDTVVAMASIMKTDYYPIRDIFPWVSSIFVTEAYRGQGISGKLIDCANAYARQCGFRRTYIPSSFFGLYEKYGYHYMKDIVNYGGGTDHLFEKSLEAEDERCDMNTEFF